MRRPHNSSALGIPVESIEPVDPSLEDVFLDVVERAEAKGAFHHEQGAGGLSQGTRIARDKRTLLIRPRARVFLLLYGYALNFRHSARPAGRPGSRRNARELVVPRSSTRYWISPRLPCAGDAERPLISTMRGRPRHPGRFRADVRNRTHGAGPGHHQRRQCHRNRRPRYASSIPRTVNEQLTPGMAEIVPPLSVEPASGHNLASTLFLVPAHCASHDHCRGVNGPVHCAREGEWHHEQIRWRRSTRSPVIGKTIPHHHRPRLAAYHRRVDAAGLPMGQIDPASLRCRCS